MNLMVGVSTIFLNSGWSDCSGLHCPCSTPSRMGHCLATTWNGPYFAHLTTTCGAEGVGFWPETSTPPPILAGALSHHSHHHFPLPHKLMSMADDHVFAAPSTPHSQPIATPPSLRTHPSILN